MSSLLVVDVSHRKNEPRGYHTFREKGQDAVLFLHFLTPAQITIDGEPQIVTRNSCIIYTPGMRQDYGAASKDAPFQNNFVTLQMDARAFFSKYNIPLNEPFYIQNEEEITACVEWIAWASANKLQSLDAEIVEHVHELFSLVEKGMVGVLPKNQRDIQTRQHFIVLRSEVMLKPKGWTVEKMAAACYLTRSRFYVLYKKFFGTNPSDDLAMAVLEFAKERLVNSSDTIETIAADCGYTRAESFIRMFGEQVGITPGKYRKREKGGS